jgi:hypothetical protein
MARLYKDFREIVAEPGFYIADGIRLGNGKFNHSSMLSGKRVLCAGELEINRAGKLVYIDNNSGHFKPTRKPSATPWTCSSGTTVCCRSGSASWTCRRATPNSRPSDSWRCAQRNTAAPIRAPFVGARKKFAFEIHF